MEIYEESVNRVVKALPYEFKDKDSPMCFCMQLLSKPCLKDIIRKLNNEKYNKVRNCEDKEYLIRIILQEKGINVDKVEDINKRKRKIEEETEIKDLIKDKKKKITNEDENEPIDVDSHENIKPLANHKNRLPQSEMPISPQGNYTYNITNYVVVSSDDIKKALVMMLPG